MPVYATVFVIITLSSIGLPGLNGFVGEFLILLGTFQTAPVAAVVGAFGVVLGAIYMLTLVRHMFFGPLSERWTALPDMTRAELATLVPLVAVAVLLGPVLAGILFIGVFPKPLLERIEPAASNAVACARLKAEHGAERPGSVIIRGTISTDTGDVLHCVLPPIQVPRGQTAQAAGSP